MIIIVICTSIAYILLITIFWIGWERLIHYNYSSTDCSTFVSVIIPMRNEETNIKNLLSYLLLQNYPHNLFEIIVIDDHSSDNSLQEALNIKSNIIRTIILPEGLTGKKKAIQYGIDQSNGDLILTCDADCVITNNWIVSHVSYHEKFSPVMLSGPVSGIYNHGFSKIQSLEMFGLMGSTAGAAALSHNIMCNGANLSFKKEIYPEIRQIYNHNISSGDDMFILQQLKKNTGQEFIL